MKYYTIFDIENQAKVDKFLKLLGIPDGGSHLSPPNYKSLRTYMRIKVEQEVVVDAWFYTHDKTMEINNMGSDKIISLDDAIKTFTSPIKRAKAKNWKVFDY